jgi:hypothetical protein
MTDVYSFGILLAYLFTGSHMAEVPSGVQVRPCWHFPSGTLALSMLRLALSPSQILSTERVSPRVGTLQWFLALPPLLPCASS